MKRELFLPFFLVSFLTMMMVVASCSAGFVSAHEVEHSGGEVHERLENMRQKREEVRARNLKRKEELQQIKDKLKARKGEIREEIATRQAEVKERVVARIKQVFLMILKRYKAALTRLDKIAERIATRIDKLKAKGVNTSVAEAKLVQAESLGSAAAQAIDDASAQIAAIDSSSATVRDAVQTAKTILKSARQALHDYHKALVGAIRELKASNELREATDEAE